MSNDQSPDSPSTALNRQTVVHLIPHTHWDREWYEPFQTFRLRLVDLIDGLLARMTADPRLRFTLDGQCATVDDYLEVRPEAETVIRALVAEGRLAIGPWQILMDEFLVSGETIVRNLELGWRRASGLGGAMPVGYLPDMFGHIAQMPQILRRAGIRRAMVWRGVPASIDRDEFLWQAPDGSVVETDYLPHGYGNAAGLFDVPDRLSGRLAAFIRTCAPFYGDRSVLAMYGTDHAAPTPRLVDLVEAVNEERGDVAVRLETLADYAASEARSAGDWRSYPPLWMGELRSGARANMLMNVTSARMDVKAAAARTECLLERYAEPLTALHGEAWPERALELAWRRVIENSAHDSICGCSHDAVHAQVLSRYAEAEQIGAGILGRTLDGIGRRVGPGRWAAVNPSPFPRDDVVELELTVPRDTLAADSRRDGTRQAVQEIGRPDPIIARLRLPGREIPELLRRRRHGRELFGRLLNGSRIDPTAEEGPTVVLLADRNPDPLELDVDELVEEIGAAVAERPDELWELIVRSPDRRVVAVRVSAPPLGWAAIDSLPGSSPDVSDASSVVLDGTTLSNGLVRVAVRPDGTFDLDGGGSSLIGVGRVVDGGDFGDSYNYAPPGRDRLIGRPSRVAIAAAEAGPLRGRLRVSRHYRWPVSVEPDGRGRTRTSVVTELVTILELRAGEPFVRVGVAFQNRSRDHRVRLHIPLPLPVVASWAEGQFAIVERGLAVEGGHGEVPLPTFPAHGFVHVDGLSVLLDQVMEYEVVGGREVALTLLRSFGLISRNANPYREDPAGPELPVTDGQRLGLWSIGFALLPHAGGWAEAGVAEQAERYRHPFLVVPGVSGGDEPGDLQAGITIDGRGVVMSSLRRRDEWLEIRLVAEHPSPGPLSVSGPFDRAREVDLLGRPLGRLPVSNGSLRLEIAPWDIRTVQLRPAVRPA